MTHAAARISIFDDLPAPAPRYLMRLALVKELIDLLPREPNRFLEIGPGMGDVSLYLRRRFPESRGTLIDFSPACTDVLRARLGTDAGVRIIDGDFRLLPRAGDCDVVVAFEVFEHLEDDDAGFVAAAGLLRPGGHFLFSAPGFMRKWQNVDEWAGHQRRYERAELTEKFRRAGFVLERIWCYGFPITALAYPLRQLYYRPRRQGIVDKISATQHSGVERGLATRLRWLPWPALLAPFFACQRLFRETNLGDGFLVLARKATGAPDRG